MNEIQCLKIASAPLALPWKRLGVTVEALGKAAASGEITVEEAQKRAIAQLKVMRYDGKEYFWVNDMQPRMIMHPVKPELNGTEIGAIKDPNGKSFVLEMVNVVRSRRLRLRKL